MPIVIHHGPAGTRGARPIWACEELGIPYEIIDVGDLAASAEYRKSPEYRKLNPVGKVPAMTDGDLTMFESVAMMQYILDRYGGGRLQPAPGTACANPLPPSLSSLPRRLPFPRSPLNRAWGSEHGLYLQWCHFAEATFSRPLGEMTNHRREFDPPLDDVLREMAGRARTCVAAIDDALSDGRKFILGDTFTAADICLGALILRPPPQPLNMSISLFPTRLKGEVIWS